MSVSETSTDPGQRAVKQLPTGSLAAALADISSGMSRWRLGAWLGWRDAILPFRRTFIGPLWATIQTGLWAVIITALLGPSLGADFPAYPVYVTSGVVFYQFLNVLIVDGAGTYIKDSGLVQNIPNPLSVYILRVVFKSVILLLIQMPIIFIAFFFTPGSVSATWLLFFPFLLIVIWAMAGLALLLASITPLYRDVPYAIQALMRVMFFATPIFWIADQRGGVRALAAQYNPLAHLLSLMRDPFLGYAPPMLSIYVTIGCGVAAWLLGVLLFSQTRSLIASNL